MGGDLLRPAPCAVEIVSIHAPAWGATQACAGRIREAHEFQSTPPHGGRLTGKNRIDISRSFNPRPRMGGDSLRLRLCLLMLVSIHAPAWGATAGGRVTQCERGFNPRPRMGGDCQVCQGLPMAKVSIHAPAWGATSADNSNAEQMQFQSTPPHGGRQVAVSLKRPSASFNPRPRMGGDSAGA